jgi:2-methylcitrate dehydratase PrpD
MSSTQTLARFIAGLDVAALPPSVADALPQHIFDSLTAAIAGAGVAETRDVQRLIEQHYGAGPALALGTGVRTNVPAAALLGCVSARCSEIDDIHLRSCITPGSIVVPAALAMASTIDDLDAPTFLAAVAAGYDVLMRFGLAIDGPRILYRGIWPTYVCAGFGVAAVLGRLLRLNESQIADALGIAATLAIGTTGRPPAPTSRWLTMGAAVQNGVLAVLGAQQGLRGDTALLDGQWSKITGIALDPERLTADLGRASLVDELCYKPWCAAKQTIAATDAFRDILTTTRLNANDITAIRIDVPPAYAAMIDRQVLPSARQESFASVQYQLALAAFAPELAYDVVRDRIVSDANVVRLMSVTQVAIDETMAASYPSAWPARVNVRLAGGAEHTRELQHPLGDPGTTFGWPELERKCARVTGFGEARVHELAEHCRALTNGGTVAALLASTVTPSSSRGSDNHGV